MTAAEEHMIKTIIKRAPRLSNNDQNFVDGLAERDGNCYQLSATENKRLIAIYGVVK